MEDISNVGTIADLIGEHGFPIVCSAVMIVLFFFFFISAMKKLNNLLEAQSDMMSTTLKDIKDGINDLLDVTKKQAEALTDMGEGARQETVLRLHTLAEIAFDKTIEQLQNSIRTIRKENHIADHDATETKVTNLLNTIHSERKKDFDLFTFKGRRISEYCKDEWVERIKPIVLAEVYHQDGENDYRTKTNISLAYDAIRNEFLENIKA